MSVALYSSLLQNSFVATRSPDTSGHELIQFIELTRMMPVGSAQPANQCAICLHFSFIVTNSVWNPIWYVLMWALVSFGQENRAANLSSELPYGELSQASIMFWLPISVTIIMLGIFPFSSSRVGRTGCIKRRISGGGFVAQDRSYVKKTGRCIVYLRDLPSLRTLMVIVQGKPKSPFKRRAGCGRGKKTAS